MNITKKEAASVAYYALFTLIGIIITVTSWGSMWTLPLLIMNVFIGSFLLVSILSIKKRILMEELYGKEEEN